MSDQQTIHAEATGVAGKVPAAGSRSLPYRPAIDGLRAVAVLSVMIFHLQHSWLPGGFVGVDIFFVISGYLITSILRKEYEHEGFSPVKFYQRRIARLMPAFFIVALATCLGAVWIYGKRDIASAGANVVAAALSVANMKLLAQGNYFQLSADAQPFLHYWSLSVEEQFYVVFPLAYFLIFRTMRRHRTAILAATALVSLAACIVLTQRRPAMAFYILPTRAWELLAGAVLADLQLKAGNAKTRGWTLLPWVGLALVAGSIVFIHEGAGFPGYVAMFPVIGTVMILCPSSPTALTERLLSWKPLVLAGRMSYSLYLWHWPIYSLVDYKLYASASLTRLSWKIGLTVACATAGYYLVESPARLYLNAPRRRWMAFGFMALCVAVFVPLGIYLRRANYIDATMADVNRGGLKFNETGKAGKLVLIGDSHASMYALMIKESCKKLGWQFNALCVSGSDALPRVDGNDGPLWKKSLEIVSTDKPDVVVLISFWRSRFPEDSLDRALDGISSHTGRVILFTQPPELPATATREMIRNGVRPPFFEEPKLRELRLKANDVVRSMEGDRVSVIDVEKWFGRESGEIYFTDAAGVELYLDRDHVSGYGADLLGTEFERILLKK